MALFVTKDGRRKSPFVMVCFFAALLFAGIFGAAYALLVGPLYHALDLGSDVTNTVVHALLISLVGTAVCCLLFFLPDKRLVPGGFVGLAVLVLMLYAAALMLQGEARSAMLSVVSMYTLAPVLVGNAVSWLIYWKIRTPAQQAH